MPGAEPVGVGAGRQGQAGPFGPVLEGGRHELVFQELRRPAMGGVEPGMPRPGPVGAEAELDQDLQVARVGVELAVVERLAVVGVGARFEEQAGQGDGVAVGRLVGLVLSPAERPGQGGEGVLAVPQVTGVGIGAGLEEEPGDGERVVPGVVAVDAGVRQVEERFPVEGTSGPARAARVLVQEPPGGGAVADGRRRGDGGAGQFGMLLQQGPGLGMAERVVAAIEQAAEPEEVVGLASGPDGLALPVRVAGVALHRRFTAAVRRLAPGLRNGREPSASTGGSSPRARRRRA
jgi:hypothetical protein